MPGPYIIDHQDKCVGEDAKFSEVVAGPHRSDLNADRRCKSRDSLAALGAARNSLLIRALLHVPRIHVICRQQIDSVGVVIGEIHL